MLGTLEALMVFEISKSSDVRSDGLGCLWKKRRRLFWISAMQKLGSEIEMWIRKKQWRLLQEQQWLLEERIENLRNALEKIVSQNSVLNKQIRNLLVNKASSSEESILLCR